MKRPIVAALAAIACSMHPYGAARAESPVAEPTSARSPAGLTAEKYKLGNGLEVVLHEDKRTPTVTVNVWYHVGSKDEPAGKNGFAHLFEHVMFQGSRHVPEDTFFKYLEQAGGTLITSDGLIPLGFSSGCAETLTVLGTTLTITPTLTNEFVFGYSYIKGSFRKCLHQKVHRRPRRHSRSYTYNLWIKPCQFDQGMSKNVLILRWLGFINYFFEDFTRYFIKFTGGMPFGLVFFGGCIPFTFYCNTVEYFRTRNIL